MSCRVRSETAIETPRARTVDMKLEVVVIPVSDEIGQRDADWPNWYAEYIVREQAGRPLPS